MSWRIYAASVAGKQHVDVGLPCQDAFAVECVGDWLIAVVADGAGSVPRSERGSSLCARHVTTKLSALARAAEGSDWCSPDAILAVVQSARDALQVEAEILGCPLHDLACTLVGIVASSVHGGWLFHLGDGMAVCRTADDSPVVSLPENGEFANETWFVTMEEWEAHLRFTALPEGLGCVALMSDGAMPFVVNRERTDLFPAFFDPVARYLDGVDESTGSEALAGTLDDQRTWKITGDDKTLLMGFVGNPKKASSTYE